MVQALENILKNVGVWEPPDSPDPDLIQQDKTNLEIVDDGDCLFSLVKGKNLKNERPRIFVRTFSLRFNVLIIEYK